MVDCDWIRLAITLDLADAGADLRKRYKQWYMSHIDAHCSLVADCALRCGVEGRKWKPDFSLDSLLGADRWYPQAIRSAPKTANDELHIEVEGRAVRIDDPNARIVATESYPLVFAMGVYMGQCFLRHDSRLWLEQEMYARAANRGAMIVRGFRMDESLDPAMASHVWATILFEQEYGAKRVPFVDIMSAWRDLLPGH